MALGKRVLLSWLLIAGAGLTLGCGPEDADPSTIPILSRPAKVISFEEYRDRSLRVINGQRVYNVEWDLFFATEEDLRAHLMSRIERETKKSTAIVDESTGGHVVFSKANALNIRYCVSSDFGAQHAEVVADMAAATKGWQNVANVRFVYLPSQDGNCFSSVSGAVDVAVISTPGNTSACGTPPSLPTATQPAWCSRFPLGSLAIDYDPTTWPWSQVAPYPNITKVGVLRHELGHILGLRHEHLRASPPCEDEMLCVNNACLGADYLTEYDVSSVMHYPNCNGDPQSAFAITFLDGIGMRKLYGMPVAWNVPLFD